MALTRTQAAHQHDAVRDPARLEALQRLALLDTPPEESFNRLTRLVTTLLHVPVALVSLVDANRQFFKGCIGLDEPWASQRETPLSHSFCQYVVASGTPLVIEDARRHALVRDNPAVLELGVVAYAGIPLMTSAGHVLGTFSAIDRQPRAWSAAEIGVLTDLAAAVMTEIELRTAVREAAHQAERAERAADRQQRLQDVTAAFSEALTPAQVADVVLHQGLVALGASAGFVALLREDGTHLDIVSAVGYAPALVDAFHSFALDSSLPVAEAMRAGKPIFLESMDDWHARYPKGAAVHAGTGHLAAAAIPLVVDARLVGGLGLSFAASRPFAEDDRAFAVTLARQCAQALERARLFEAAQAARAVAEQAHEQLAEIDRLRADFIAAASHELQTPLTAIRASLHLLELGSKDQLGPDERRLLEIARHNVEHLRVHIDDLLTANQLEAGTLNLECAALDVRSVVARVLELVHPLLQEKGQALELDLPEPLMVQGDLRRLEQVILNLLANAQRHTPPGTHISVHGQASADEVLLSVSDTGPGIPGEDLEIIFERFRRLNTDHGGSGLGLAIARGLATLHGGRLWAESGCGCGATFHLALPRMLGTESPS